MPALPPSIPKRFNPSEPLAHHLASVQLCSWNTGAHHLSRISASFTFVNCKLQLSILCGITFLHSANAVVQRTSRQQYLLSRNSCCLTDGYSFSCHGLFWQGLLHRLQIVARRPLIDHGVPEWDHARNIQTVKALLANFARRKTLSARHVCCLKCGASRLRLLGGPTRLWKALPNTLHHQR
jgi:hypothetical protein